MFKTTESKQQNEEKLKKSDGFQTSCPTPSIMTKCNKDIAPHSMPNNTKTKEIDIDGGETYEESSSPTNNIKINSLLSVEYQVQLNESTKQTIDSTCKYSKLTKLTESDIQDCLAVQEKMLLNMKLKFRSFNFTRKRSEEDFAVMISKGELFGTYDNNKLVGIVSIAPINKETLVSIFTSSSNNLLIDDLLAKIFLRQHGCYLSCLMTDLNQTGTDLAVHMMHSLHKIINEHCYKYSIAEIHIQNPASYKSFIKIDKISFALSNKAVSFVNVNGEKVMIPVSYFVSVHNNNFANIFEKMFKESQSEPFEYSQNTVDLIMNPNNSDSDVVLKKDEVIRFIDGKLVKTKLNLELLKEFLDNQWCSVVNRRSSSCIDRQK